MGRLAADVYARLSRLVYTGRDRWRDKILQESRGPVCKENASGDAKRHAGNASLHETRSRKNARHSEAVPAKPQELAKQRGEKKASRPKRSADHCASISEPFALDQS